MKTEDETIFLIKGMIASLPPAMQDQCGELCEHMRHIIKTAGEPVGQLALALIGAEEQAKEGK